MSRYLLPLLCLAVLAAAGAALRAALAGYRAAVRLDTLHRTPVQLLTAPLVRQLMPRTEDERRELKQRLVLAGLRSDEAVKSFGYTRAIVLVGALFVSAVVALFQLGLAATMLTALTLLYLSVKGPEVWLNQVIASRQARIARALPALIDLMVLCLDVGLSIEAAFEKVSHEMQSMEPLLAEEAEQMVNEMGAGVVFPQALKRLADRVGLEELITMARLIAQASGLGASITQALREYSEASFTKRMLTLEEHAGKISAWLVMPLTLCMLPACLLALAGPAIVIAMRSMRS